MSLMEVNFLLSSLEKNVIFGILSHLSIAMESSCRSDAEHDCAENVESHEQTDLPVGAHDHSDCYKKQKKVKSNFVKEAP